jgi:hypothetical protein
VKDIPGLGPHAPDTVAVAVPTGVSYGNCTFNCPPLAYTNGAPVPLTETDDPASEVGSGVAAACCAFNARPLPNIEISDPGATGAVVNVAPFTTPFAAIDGTPSPAAIFATNPLLPPPMYVDAFEPALTGKSDDDVVPAITSPDVQFTTTLFTASPVDPFALVPPM